METSEGGLPPRQGATHEGSKPAGAKKSQVSPARNIFGLVLLLVLVPVAALEFKAVNDYNQAAKKLDKILVDEAGDLVSQADVEKLIGKKADGPLQREEGATQLATYTWRGVFKTHVIKAHYTLGEKASGLLRVGD